MKRILLVVAMVMLAGCGSGGNSGESVADIPPIDSTPNIAVLTVNPTTVYKNQGGGYMTINVGFNFFDRGGDLYGGSVLLKTFDFSGNLIRTDSIPSNEISYKNATSGTYGLYINLNTSTPANYTFTINLIDSGGRSSNTLNGFFAITS